MKNLIICLFISIGLWSCNHSMQKTSYSIEGSIEGISDSTKVIIFYLTEHNEKWVLTYDSTYLVNGKFVLNGNINELTAASLLCGKIEISLYIEPVPMKLVISNENPYRYELSGTSIEKESIELQNLLSDNTKIRNIIGDSIQAILDQAASHNNEPALVDSLMQRAYSIKEKYTMNAKRIDSLQYDFVIKHNTYQITPYVVYTLLRGKLIGHDSIVALYDNLPEHSKTTSLGKLALAQLKDNELTLNRKDISVGDIAPDFSKETIQGKNIKLSDFRNKNYVLLDFWASWCGPCMKQIPQIKMIQDTYANKGLQIIGVSADGDEQEWRNTVEKHQMNSWLHILGSSDPGSYFNNTSDISLIYNIQTIPLYIFIDKQGKVIARWQHIGEEELAFINNALNTQDSSLRNKDLDK